MENTMEEGSVGEGEEQDKVVVCKKTYQVSLTQSWWWSASLCQGQVPVHQTSTSTTTAVLKVTSTLLQLYLRLPLHYDM